MLLLLEKIGRNNYKLLSPTVYTMQNWSNSAQEFLKKARKHWYVEYWSAGNQWIDESTEQYKLNIVLETYDIDEVGKYLYNKLTKDKAPNELYTDAWNSILKDYQEIVESYIGIEKMITDEIIRRN